MKPTPIEKKKIFNLKNTINSKVENIKEVLKLPVAKCDAININKPDHRATLFPNALSNDLPTLSQM